MSIISWTARSLREATMAANSFAPRVDLATGGGDPDAVGGDPDAVGGDPDAVGGSQCQEGIEQTESG